MRILTENIGLQLPVLFTFVWFHLTAAKDYCSWESFNPVCKDDKVIVMQTALYGIMELGQCVKVDIGYLGCSEDQMWYFDQQCSGRKQCEILVGFDKALKDRLSVVCPEPYLEATYNCQKVMVPPNNQCNSPFRITISPTAGYIASLTSSATSCGHGNAPWTLEAKPGQAINLTLIDFSWSENGPINDCPKTYGHILSYADDDIVNICGGKSRVQHIKISKSHQLQIVFEESLLADSHFMITHQALGCPDVTPPKNAWVRRSDNEVTIGCHSSVDTWQLKCVGTHWIGKTGNCTEVTTQTALPVQEEAEEFSAYHVMAFSIGCMALIVCCVTITLGVYCIKRYRIKIESSYIKANRSDPFITSPPLNWQTTLVANTAKRNPDARSSDVTTLPDITNASTLATRPRMPRPGSVSMQGTLMSSRANDASMLNSMGRNDTYGGSHISDDGTVKYFVLEKPPIYANG